MLAFLLLNILFKVIKFLLMVHKEKAFRISLFVSKKDKYGMNGGGGASVSGFRPSSQSFVLLQNQWKCQFLEEFDVRV